MLSLLLIALASGAGQDTCICGRFVWCGAALRGVAWLASIIMIARGLIGNGLVPRVITRLA